MEENLIRRARAGDQAAFRTLVERYLPVAWRICRILLADRGMAEDALQDAWIDVWSALPRVDMARPLRPWLLTVVANRCRMAARRRISTPYTQAVSCDVASCCRVHHLRLRDYAPRSV